jgi:hypothetical protein
MPPLVYWNAKLTHTGVTGYKVFENCDRHISHNSLKNLLNVSAFSNQNLRYWIQQFKAATTDELRSQVNDHAVEELCADDFTIFLQETRQTRKLNPAQSRKVKRLAQKLAYYSQSRQFTSKKSGKYNMRVAFLTLTAPEGTTTQAMCSAFEHFLDYLRRTANCVFIWKKEIGETNGHLHFHLLINNFIPYYIISWKWKRLLINEGVAWPCGADGKHTDSHYRVELPRSRKLVAHYIAKYMSKAFDLPREYGYIAGHSKILDELKELPTLMDDLPPDEIEAISHHSKVITGDYVTLFCLDLLKAKSFAPLIFEAFETQYLEFSNKITLPQKFWEV